MNTKERRRPRPIHAGYLAKRLDHRLFLRQFNEPASQLMHLLYCQIKAFQQ